MTYPNAKKGVGNILVSEILALIGAVMLGIASIAIIAAIKGNQEQVLSDSTSAGTILGGGLFAILGTIVVFIGFIFMIVGIVRARKDEVNFKNALYIMIAYIIFYALANIIFKATGIGEYSAPASKILELFVTYFIVSGIISLAEKLKDSEVEAKGRLFIKILITAYVLETIVSLINISTINKVAHTISVFLVVALLIISVVKYILYIVLLVKANRMLKA